MARRFTHDDFLCKLNERNLNAKHIEILSIYKNANSKIRCRCTDCNYEWETLAKHLISQTKPSNCPNCNILRQRKSHDDFLKEFVKSNKNNQYINILSKYETINSRVHCQCKKCNHEWYPIAKTLLNGNGCPKCGGTLKKTHETFIKELYNINVNIVVLNKYINDRTKVKCLCKRCNCIWEAVPNHLLRYRGCPRCNSSKGETRIRNILLMNNIKFKEQFKFKGCKDIYPLPFDFAIYNNDNELRFVIEYQGEQHYVLSGFNNAEEIFERYKRHDKIKKDYCKKNNIKLLEIPYYEFNNIENILKEHLS